MEFVDKVLSGGVVDVQKLLACRNIVGESAVWCDRSRRLLWVDIVGCRIHAYTPLTGARERWPTPERVTSIGLREDGGCIVGLERDVALWDYGEQFDRIATIESASPQNRLNEGRVGPDGAFWVGTMQNNIDADGLPAPMDQASGAYHRIDMNHEVERLTGADYGICNTMAWTDDRRFLCADTLANQLYAFHYDGMTISERAPFGVPQDRGLPDGSTLDAEGYLWNCRVGGGAIMRFAPDGSVDQVVELPCTAPTSCAFGGDQLDTLYITSATFGLAEDRRDHPDEGALYALKPGVGGRPEHRFGKRAS